MIILNMKKTFLFLALASIAITSCRKDDDEIIPEVNIETQNSYDTEAAQKFLQTHAFDLKGNIKEYVETDLTQVKLSDLDIIRLMSTTITYIATNTDNKIAYTSPYIFRNTISGTGIPEVDPPYYNVKQSVLDNATLELAKQRSFYEIEGFKEALQKFKAFDMPDESNYNLQGVIIVPSRAAFARDAHFNYSGVAFKDRSFVFNFQVYKTTPR